MKLYNIIKSCFLLRMPIDWFDISSDLGANVDVLTLSKADGVGAFQISAAQYASGTTPHIKHIDLVAMITNYANLRNMRMIEHPTVGNNSDGNDWCSAEFKHDGDYIKIWFVSNSKSVAIATYLCNLDHKNNEADECDMIINYMSFI